MALVVDHQKLLDAMLMKQLLSLVKANPLLHRDQALVRHEFAHRRIGIGGKPHVAVGHDAGKASIVSLDYREAGDLVPLLQLLDLGKRGFGRHRNRVDHHAGFELLDPAHFVSLLRDIKIFVDHADAAGLRHGDGEGRLGDRIHGGRDQWDAKRNVAGKARPGLGIGGQHRGFPGWIKTSSNVSASRRSISSPGTG